MNSLKGANMLAAFIDFETGGLTTDCSVLEVGVAIVEYGPKMVIVDTFDCLVKHEQYVVTPDALKVNGISLEECHQEGETLSWVQDRVWSFFSSYTDGTKPLWAGWNCPFDRSFAQAQLPMLLSLTHYRVFDVGSIYAWHRGFARLQDAVRALKVTREIDTPHRALSDVLDTRGVAKQLWLLKETQE
jgi:oligoribonuclease (3'-5' exoribonuclease)